MNRLSRDAFLREFADKPIDVHQAEINPALDLQARTALRNADLDGDGKIATANELNALFNGLDNLERNEGSRNRIRVATDEGRTALGRVFDALREAPPADTRQGSPLRRLVADKPHLRSNQHLINHFLNAARNDWGRAERIAQSFGTDLNTLVENRGAPIDLGPEPVGEPAAPDRTRAAASPAQTLGGSVGVGGANNPDDVARVQQVLEARGFLEAGSYESGQLDTNNADDPTVAAIRRFQGEFTGIADGRVDVEGLAHNALREAAVNHEYDVLPGDSPLAIIRDAFLALTGSRLPEADQRRILDLTAELNPNAPGLRDGELQAGDRIELPSTELVRERLGLDTAYQQRRSERTHTIRGGENLSAIARRHGVSLPALIAANPQITDPNLIHPGQILVLPTAGASPSPQGTAPTTGPTATTGPTGPVDFEAVQFRPNSPEAIALFREAARRAGLPESWATSQGLHNILSRESNGWVGIPNYSYQPRSNDRSQWPLIHAELREGRLTGRAVTAEGLKSSATGLGQMILPNVRAFYPSGVAGIGDPVEEAIGMLRYIESRYGNPDNAWRLYGTRHEGY